MSRKSVERGASLLALVILATILWRGHLPHSAEASTLYLGVASFVDLYCLLILFFVLTEQRKSGSMETVGFLQTRAQLLFLIAWQLTVVGVLHVFADNFIGTQTVFILCGLLLAMCLFISDRMIAFADSPYQDGGSRPLHFFKRPRSRRVFFWAFIVYCGGSFGAAAVNFFIGLGSQSSLLHPPQLCLLFAAAVAAATAAFVIQRYHGLTFSRQLAAACFLPAVAVLGIACVFEIYSGSSPGTFWTSSVIVTCISLSAYWLLRGNGGGTEGPTAQIMDTKQP
jgi:hypothetical protein